MADAPSTDGPPAPPIPRIRDNQYREYYSNLSIMALSPFDVVITFQKNSELSPGMPGVIDLVSVTMSPQHFKGFVRAATEVLQAYENGFGALSISEQDTAPARTADELEGMIKNIRANAAATKASPSSTEKPKPSKRSRGAAPE